MWDEVSGPHIFFAGIAIEIHIFIQLNRQFLSLLRDRIRVVGGCVCSGDIFKEIYEN